MHIPLKGQYLIVHKIGWFRWSISVMNTETGIVKTLTTVWGKNKESAKKKGLYAINTALEGMPPIEVEGFSVPLKIRMRLTEKGAEVYPVRE